MRGGFIYSKTCSQCAGTGKINSNPCGSCHGSKTSTVTDDIEITIPAGVTEEYALQYKGKGNHFGRLAGDLIIRLTVNCFVFY